MGKQNKQTNLTMKFTAALLFATATAGYSGYGHGKGEQVAVAGYDAPETQLLNWTKSYTSDYKKIDVDAIVNDNQEHLLAEILLADMYYDHTRIAKLLDVDGKSAALTWEEDVRPAAETIGDSYLSWNARDPVSRTYNEYYTA